MKTNFDKPVLILFSLFVSLSVQAHNYVLTDLGVLPGFMDVRAAAINNHGQIVGWCETTNNIAHAFLWDNGRMTDLGTFGGSKSLAEGINNSGEIVGAFVRDGKCHAFLWQHGHSVDLGILNDSPNLGGPHDVRPGIRINNSGQVACWQITKDGRRMSILWENGQDIYFGLLADGKTTCYALDLNDAGQIAGVIHRGDGLQSRAFLWESGTVSKLETLGGINAAAEGINNLGTIIGWSTLKNGSFKDAHAVVWKSGKIRDLGTLGGNHARAYGINNADQITGYTSKRNGHDVAFLWEHGQMFDLNEMVASNGGWRLKCGDAINDDGQIVALAWKDGISHACLLSPVLPPSRLASAQTNQFSISENLTKTIRAFRLDSFVRSPNGDFKLDFSGAFNGTYTIEASTNLQTWIPLGSASFANGRMEFVDTNAPKFNLRFYRVVLNRNL